jgi:hypothetical protein
MHCSVLHWQLQIQDRRIELKMSTDREGMARKKKIKEG